MNLFEMIGCLLSILGLGVAVVLMFILELGLLGGLASMAVGLFGGSGSWCWVGYVFVVFSASRNDDVST